MFANNAIVVSFLGAIVSCTAVPETEYSYDEKCQQFTKDVVLKPVVLPIHRSTKNSCSDHECIDMFAPTAAEVGIALLSGAIALTQNVINDIEEQQLCEKKGLSKPNVVAQNKGSSEV